jgi:two-component system phosphate regulon response regulator PhoB
MSKKRIIIIEDEQDMAELVALRLRKEGYQVDVAHDGVEGLERIQAAAPDLVVLDIMLPGMPGTEVAVRLRSDARTSAIPILMLTAKSEESDIVVGLKMGADDYVTKPFSMSVLAARVGALLRRKSAAAGEGDEGVIRLGPIVLDQNRHTVEVEGRPITLTLTEFRILAALLAAKGRVLSRNQLMDQAMGLDTIVTDRTIDVHLTALRRKLGPARGLIETVRGMGYKMSEAS